MKTKLLSTFSGLLFGITLLSALNSFGQYNQNVTNVLAPGPNVIEKSATTTMLATFQSAVALAWTNNSGGVFNFPTGITPNTTTVFRGNYGTNGSRMQITSSVNMQNITTSATSFTVVSTPNGTTSTANTSDYTLSLGLFNTNSGLPVVDQAIKQIGFVVLSRGTTTGTGPYPLDLRVTVTFSDSSTQTVTSVIGYGSSADDTFFGFTAPENLTINSVRLQSFVTGTSTPVADRIGLDDFGFITGPSAVTPQPQIVGVTPAAYAITAATNGIHFQALTYVSINQTNISLVLNSNDVSSQLVFSGDPTNYSVAYNGLLPDQEYNLTINVTNSGGVATLSRTFYTATNSFVLYDSEGFTSDTLYPEGALQSVVHGRATWFPNTNEPPAITTDGSQGKVLQRDATGASRADFLSFPPVSSGVIVMEFDAFVSTVNGRTIDICLQPLTGGTTMASFISWGEVTAPTKLVYFDNANWIPLSDLESAWHHVKIVNYLSGPAAGKYDVEVNGTPVGQKLPWRNATVGSAFNQFRIQTQNTASLFEYGRIDNLVITASPEFDVALPPAIVNLSPTNNSIVNPANGIQFGVTSAVPVAASDIALLVNGASVAVDVTGTPTNLSLAYTPLTAGNYNIEIRATNSAGISTVTATFLATTEPWLLDTADGWVGPWQWTSGTPMLETNPPLDGVYVQLDTTGGPRNLMRQYQSSPSVDISQPHFIRWKFRLPEPDFAANFIAANDRVHFFARNAPRLIASTDAADSWAISVTGAEQGSGVSAGQRFYIFDNIDGSANYNLANLVDSQIQLFPDNLYSFEVEVFPQSQRYSVVISNETSGASFRSVSPHLFRATNVPPNMQTFLHFGVQSAVAATFRPFDLDSVFITQAPFGVTLLNPQRTSTTFTFSFASQDGVNYLARYRDSLSTGTWQTLTTIPGDGSVKIVTDLSPSSDTRFYQIVTQ